MADLEGLRRQIDGIDDQITKLLSDRFQIATEIAKIKKQANMPIANPEREEQILARIPSAEGKEVYRAILSASRKIQDRT